MVKDILNALIKGADRINFTVLLPQALDQLKGNDASFETASSSKIKTLKLFYKYNIATQSIGLVFAHNLVHEEGFKGKEVLCHKMLKYGLKLDRVHTYKDFSLSQLEEKITWIIEKTTGDPLSNAKLKA